MSSENEGQLSLRSPSMGSSAPVSDQKSGKPRIRYTREFFLSLSELDVCKKLPSGLDKSILSSLEEAANTAFERPRNACNLSLQGSRRGVYGSQSLNKSENSNSYTKGISSRWDTRSSGSSDREGDLQLDSLDSGRKFGNQNRRTWQDLEHDGLLGSGALARPPGFTGASALKARGNAHYQLSRSTESYQPQRPYKATSYSRKDGSDLCNDETFGSSECLNVDRAEEERRRRASFELMRNEQQQTLQKKHNNDIHKGNLEVDIMALLDNSDADKIIRSTSKPDESATVSVSSCDSSKSSSLIPVSAARPLVPPGFANTLMEKNSQINKLKSTVLQSANEKENPSVASLVEPDIGFSNIPFNTSALKEVNEVWEEDMPNDSFHKKEAEPDKVDAATQDHSQSIFDKLFGKALVKNSGILASDIQKHANKANEEALTIVASESSKFAHLFHEESEENIPIEDKSSRDLLSLVVNNECFSSHVYKSSNDEATEKNQSNLSSENAAVLLSSPEPSPITGMLLESYQGDEQRSHAVLTCEDLEQSILAEVELRCSVMQSLQEPFTSIDARSEEHKDAVDDNASHHLLSLLQRTANSKSLESHELNASGSYDMHSTSDVKSSLHFQSTDDSAVRHFETEHRLEKRSTLEALFGAAFMNELHSMEAPVSAQKTLVSKLNDSGATQSHGVPFYPLDCVTSTPTESHLKKADFEGEMLGEILHLNNATEHERAHNSTKNTTGYRDSSLLGFKLGDLAFEQAPGDIYLPEEDSLISLNNSIDTVASDSLCFRTVNRNESHVLPEKMAGDLSTKLLHAILRVGDTSGEPAVDYPAFMQTSHEKAYSDGDYHHLHVRPTLHVPHQMNYGRPFFDTHSDHPNLGNSRMNFLNPDVMHHDPHVPFALNVPAHHGYNSGSVLQLDPTARHHKLQPIPLPGNFHSHAVQGLPRVPRPVNHFPGFSYEMTNLHVPPPHHQQLNYGGRGMGIPGHGGGTAASGWRSQETLERLTGVEMRAKAKQFRPYVVEQAPEMYGAELDMNSRYM